MRRIEAGMFALSLTGHDKGRLYLVIKAEDGYVYLADGELRSLEKMKKKKEKHIQIIYRTPEGWNPEQISNDDVKRAIRQYKKSLQAHN